METEKTFIINFTCRSRLTETTQLVLERKFSEIGSAVNSLHRIIAKLLKENYGYWPVDCVMSLSHTLAIQSATKFSIKRGGGEWDINKLRKFTPI